MAAGLQEMKHLGPSAIACQSAPHHVIFSQARVSVYRLLQQLLMHSNCTACDGLRAWWVRLCSLLVPRTAHCTASENSETAQARHCACSVIRSSLPGEFGEADPCKLPCRSLVCDDSRNCFGLATPSSAPTRRIHGTREPGGTRTADVRNQTGRGALSLRDGRL